MNAKYIIWPILCFSFMCSQASGGRKGDDEDEDVYNTKDPSKREPSPCEICKYFTTELQMRLDETGKSKEVLETGHGLDLKKKRFAYRTSELRLEEALNNPHVCERILEYNVHAEREGSLRYAKGQSETMSTLHGLRNKGVKVELGIPEELWDKPSAEVTKMHRACFHMAERIEDDIEDWYYHHQDEAPLVEYVCRQRILKGKDISCLGEKFDPSKKRDDEDDNEEKPKKKKNKTKKGKNKNKGDSGTDNTKGKKKDEL